MKPPSTKLGPYELVTRIGAGGMAETFRAERKGPAGFKQEVCLKRVLPSMVADREFVELFLEEARIQSRLRHGNIVQVYDFGEADGAYYLALELVDGLDLRSVLTYLERRGQRLPIPIVLLVLRELCRGLEVTHNLIIDGVAQHLVHRDISPSNILVSTNGEVKLTDFGIATSHSRQYKTETGKMRGKLGYMPPEQIRGDALDARSDLFSLGVVLYQMLAGAPPFWKQGLSDYQISTRVLRGEHARIKTLVPEVSGELAALTEAMIAPDPASRPSSAREVLERTASLAPPVHADRDLAALVSTAKRSREAEEARALAGRSSRKITVPGPGPNDTTSVAAAADIVPRTSPSLPTDAAAQGDAIPHAVTRSSPVAHEPVTLDIASTQSSQRKPSRRAWLALLISATLLLAVAVLFTQARPSAVRSLPSSPASSSPPPPTQPRSKANVNPARSVEESERDAPSMSLAKAPGESPAESVSAAPAVVLRGSEEVERAPSSAHSQATPQSPTNERDADAFATLRVMISPFGSVWLDGSYVGEAPVNRRVPAGVHVVEARGADGRNQRVKVRIKAGQDRVVRLRLDSTADTDSE